MCSEQTTTSLRVAHCSLGPLHFELDAHNVPKSSTVTLRISSSGTPVPALVLTGTSRCFIFDSFYDKHIAKTDFGGLRMAQKLQPTDLGVSHCEFDAVQGFASGGSRLNKLATQSFPGRVTGIVQLPFMLDGHKFIHFFLLLDYIFASEEIQTRFPAVLGTDFLRKSCLRTQWTLGGFELKLPKAIKLPKQLYIHTSGSCILDSASGRCRRRSGYGMHFVGLPQEANWDIWSPLAANEMETEDQAKLIAVINAMHLASERCHLMGVRISTDSEYVFHGVRDWFPNWKETGEEGGLRLKDIDRFEELDKLLRLLKRFNLLKVEVCLLPLAENLTAYGLAKKGAEFTLASQLLQSHDLEGKKEDSTKGSEQWTLEISWQMCKEMLPLIQWSPSGTHWLEWKPMADSKRLDLKAGLGDAGSRKKFFGEQWNPTEADHLGIRTEFSFTAAYEKSLNHCNTLTRDEYLALHPDFEKYEKAFLDLDQYTSGHQKAP